MPSYRITPIPLLLLFAIGGCAKPAPDGDAGTGTRHSGAATQALRDRIIVDPQRVANAAAPVERTGEPDVGRMLPGCRETYRHDAGWARKLPVALPLYPGARVVEAAGSDVAGCRMRIVSFTSTDPVATLLDFYAAHATRARYTADREAAQGGTILAGTRGDLVYYLTASAIPGGGTSVGLVANHGG